MRRFLPVLCVPVLLLGGSVPKTGPTAIQGAIPQTGRVPVLVELFTSDACAICPAAGEVVRTL
ncbi:MAG TPA: hypothetical protein VLM42_10180 [Bryobacteraceae bacterium]|nr:hypothetical protein [Bryobacteraceae bacterium]